MTTYYLTGKEPGVASLLSAAGVTGKRISYEVASSYAVRNTFWDGGSRYSYTAVQLQSHRAADMPQYDPPQFGGPKVPDQPTAPGVIVVEHHSFSCKDYYHLYVHPSDAPALLPAEAEAITEDQKTVLRYTSALKNTYGGRTNIRFTEANLKTGISSEDWETAKAALISSGHLRKQGSITPDGRNAIADSDRI